MSSLLAMFPGQGSQFVGMAKGVLDEFPNSKKIFEEAEDAIKISIRRLCIEGPESDLRLTANTQPCILTTSIAYWRVLKEEAGISPKLFAGHSLGEYSAVVAAGKLSLSRAVFLVRKRGEAMQKAVPEGVGAMAAVINCPEEKLVEKCEQISKPSSLVEVVNFNSPQQLVVAGHKTAVEELCGVLETEGLKSVLLPVSAPFHSSLMRPAREEMTPLLEGSKLNENDSKIIANLTGQVETPYQINLLIKQIDSPVRWTTTLKTALENGCDTFVEIGPGKVLFSLARRSLPKEAKLLHTENLKNTIKDLGSK